MTGGTLADRSALAIQGRLRTQPEILVTLGSGLAGLADAVRDPVDIPVVAVPGLPSSAVSGHTGVLRAGTIGGREVLVQVGRVHLYEGHSAAAVARVVDAAARLGCTTFLVTNAAGGLHEELAVGDLVAISDHLNLTGTTPLSGPRFVDLGGAYDPALRELAHAVAQEQGTALLEGVYAGLAGPAYETPAEVRMLRTLGADLVGMSTVTEVVAARANGLRVLGLSLVTNVHGRGGELSHDDVLQVGQRAAERMSQLVLGVIERLPPAR